MDYISCLEFFYYRWLYCLFTRDFVCN